MNLQQFSSSLITTPAEGKSMMNILIGMSPSGPNVLDALIALYESMPNDIKGNLKAFAPTFSNMFCKYEMQEKHLPYYDKFSPIWGPSEIATIKKKYAELLKGGAKQSFKNSLEFSKALSAIQSNGPKGAFEFIESHLDSLEPVLKKGTAKFIENLNKQHCWERLIETDYNRFKSLCVDLSINFLDVLKLEYSTSYYGFKWVASRVNDLQFLTILKDVKEDSSFFNGSSFFSPKDEKEDKSHINVFELSIRLLNDEKYNSFYHLFTTYPNEIAKCMQSYMDNRGPSVDILNVDHWNEVLGKMFESSKSYGSKEIFYENEMRCIYNKLAGNFKMIEVIILEKGLPEKEDVKTKKIKI